jgi:hypothetical protein
VPLVRFEVTRPVLGEGLDLTVLAEHAGPLEDGLALLPELAAQWGPGGQLHALASAPPLEAVPVSAETALLLSLARPCGVHVDTSSGTARAAGLLGLPGVQDQQALAVDLLVAELLDAGCVGVRAALGPVVRVAGAAPDHRGWPCAVPSALGGRPHEVWLRDEALAVVVAQRPCWHPSGARPVDVVAVAAPHAWTALRAAAAGAAAGARQGMAAAVAVLRRDGLPALVDGPGGPVVALGAWARGGAAEPGGGCTGSPTASGGPRARGARSPAARG